MTLRRFAVSAFALVLGVTVPGVAHAYGAQQGGAYGYGQDRGAWDAPPREFSAAQRQGFHDGMEGARKDFGNHRQPDPNNRDEYRHPDVPRGQWDAYRYGFRMGYERAMAHLTGGTQPPYQGPGYQGPGYQGPGDRGPARADPGPGYGPNSEIELRGFQDGMEGALRDLENHRQPSPENRDEFRHPDVPNALWGPYREGFRRGYRRGIAALTGEFGGGRMGPGDEIGRRGFEDGVEGALKDFSNHRRPDPDNRDEYRHPDVPYPMQGAYRDGFRRGYNVAMRELMGDEGRR
jgi:hypothetical protein